MKVLIVEDRPEFNQELAQIFDELPRQSILAFAISRDSALLLLESEFFDLIVLDLKIPTVDSALDADPQHGHAAFAHARKVCPGTPILVLTGSQIEDFVPAMLKTSQQVDIWGEEKKISTITFVKKLQIGDVPAILSEVQNAVDSLSEVELDRGIAVLGLAEERLLRIFVKNNGGGRCRVTQLSGGLSGAKVFRLRVSCTDGSELSAVAKLASAAIVEDEGRRFDKFVNRLSAKATPRKLPTLFFGGGATVGAFYSLVDESEMSAFDFAELRDGRAKAAVESVEAATLPWAANVPASRRAISDLRRVMLSDLCFAEICHQYNISWATSFERNVIQCKWACVHGDLHCWNVLFASDLSAVIIDYNDVEYGPASFDAITLEFSLIFHPQTLGYKSWPSVEQAKCWGNLEVYLQGCPFEEFIRSCRAWSYRVAAGKREICAAAYAYLIKQLKYEDTNKEIALALLDGVAREYNTT